MGIDHEKFEGNRDRFLNQFKPKKDYVMLTNQEVPIYLKQYADQSKNGHLDERLHEWIVRCMPVLTPRQRRVVELRFGLKAGQRAMTHREVAERMGIGIRRVQLHWAEAMRKLKQVHTPLEGGHAKEA